MTLRQEVLRREGEDGTDEHSGGDDAMRRPMLDCAKPATWPAIGQSRLALNKKLIAMSKNYPVFGSAGSMDIRDMWLNTDTREQFIVVRYTEDEVAALRASLGREPPLQRAQHTLGSFAFLGACDLHLVINSVTSGACVLVYALCILTLLLELPDELSLAEGAGALPRLSPWGASPSRRA